MHITGGLFSTAEFSMLQARKEIVHFGEPCQKSFNYVLEMRADDDPSINSGQAHDDLRRSRAARP